MASTSQRQLTAAELEPLCQVLADTSEGLTGSEIERLLRQARIPDPDPANTKWKRLFNALASEQTRVRAATPILNFIHHAMAPARYAGKPLVFEERRVRINVTLAFLGLEFQKDGRFRRVDGAATLDEAHARADRLRAALLVRGVHADVLMFCRAELVANDSFHAVLEATKSIAEKLRQKGGLTEDGAKLVDQALGGADPLLRINALSSPSERDEQSGFLNLVKGLFGVFRNPTAHSPRVSWPMSEEDALDLFSIASYAHRRIERATKRP
jgi:uncharacterized protein (TIGR02391 family)